MKLNVLDIQVKIRETIEDINTQDIDEYKEGNKNALVDLLWWIMQEKGEVKGLTSYFKRPGGTLEEQLQSIQDKVLKDARDAKKDSEI